MFTFALIVCFSLLLHSATSESIFGIGKRAERDELLLKDELEARALGLEESPTIIFNYALPEPITYIEILSLENVYADVNFSYYNDLVNGSITAANGFVSIENDNYVSSTTTTTTPNTASPSNLPPFNVLIEIYGYRDNLSIVNASDILNRDQQFTGWLKPIKYDNDGDPAEYLNLSDQILQLYDEVNNNAKRHQHHDFDDDIDEEDATDDGITDDEGINDDDIGNDENVEDEFNNADKIIELGQRQRGDHLIYETYQTSPTATQMPSTHSVVFYYIDSNYITYARFVVFDLFNPSNFLPLSSPQHTSDRMAEDYNPPVAEYSHFTPRSLKAVITHDRTTNLFVQMFLYGYNRTERPVDYKPFLGSMNAAGVNKTPAYFTISTVLMFLMRWGRQRI